MQTNLPFRNLLKYSLRTAIGVGCIVVVTGTTVETSWILPIYRGITTFLLFFIFCLISIFLLRAFEIKGKEVATDFFSKRFFCGFAIAFIPMVAMHFLNLELTERGILPKSYHESKLLYSGFSWQMIAYTLLLTFIIYILVYFFHNFVLLLFEKSRSEIELSELKAANFETANQLLRQQIQPHFLFNALNVLKSLIRKYPSTAEEYLVRLSDFLRASFTLGRTDTATLEQELKLCEDYMEMQQIRFGNSIDYQVKIDKNDPVMALYLPFFSVQLLLENAIKHNKLTETHPLHIEISTDGYWIKVENDLQPKSFVENSTGNGLVNLKERYRIVSGDEIVIRMTDTKFSVEIKLLENEYHRNRG